jgi:hypothetical protein
MLELGQQPANFAEHLNHLLEECNDFVCSLEVDNGQKI